MSAVPLSPIHKVSHPSRTASHDSTSDGLRKRVCKACDRCRLKKSKCDGLTPCSRCKADNAICVFGERKKSHDKVYPKGYVEMLEQQQSQLVTGLQEMYKRLQAAQAWTGPALLEVSGQPLTHDILAALDLLETSHEGGGEPEIFEDDCQRLQSKLLADGAGYLPRRGSSSSDSDRSQHAQRPSPSNSRRATASKTPVFQEDFAMSSPSSPLSQSSAPRQPPSFQRAQQSPLQQTTSSSLPNDPQLYRAEWSIPDMSSSNPIMQSKYAVQPPEMQPSMPDMEAMFGNNVLDVSTLSFDANFGGMPATAFAQQTADLYGDSMQSAQGFGPGFEPMTDVEFSNFIQVST